MSSDMIPRFETIWIYQFRVVLLGDSTVGKSALLRRFTDGCFIDISDPTVGVDFYSRLIEVSPGTRVKLQLWDTAGQERFRSITRSYYRNSAGAIIVYDVTNRASFDHISGWINEAKLHVAPNKMSFALVGQKCDLISERKVSYEEGSAFARCHRMPYVEASAKENVNVEESFFALTELLYRLVTSGSVNTNTNWDGIKCGLVPKTPTADDTKSKKQNCCS